MKDFLRGQISAAIAIATNARESVQREARIGVRADFTESQRRRIEAALFAASAELVKAIAASEEKDRAGDGAGTTEETGGIECQ